MRSKSLQYLVGATAAGMMLVTVTAGGVAGAAGGSPAARQAHQVKWHTLVSDNFNGKAGTPLKGPTWRYFHGRLSGMATYEQSPAYASLDGHGNLLITARHTKSGWRSAQVATVRTFMPQTGQTLRAQAVVRMPLGGKGYWPAFWSLAAKAITHHKSEPAAGELDIAETSGDSSWVAEFVHCGPSKWAGPCKEPSSKVSHYHKFKRPAGEVGFHTYTMLWTNLKNNKSITFLVDNHRQLTVKEQQIGAKYWDLAFEHPYIFLFDIAVGSWGGKPNRSTHPNASMRVASFSVSVAEGAPPS